MSNASFGASLRHATVRLVRHPLTWVLLAVAFGAGFTGGVMRRHVVLSGTLLSGSAPELGLNRAGGAPFRFADERGKVTVLFFGYTHCPDVCPTTLSHVAQARAQLPPGERDRLLALFVSVDVDRDDARASDAYAKLFAPDFIGLGGTRAQIAAAERSYHVWSQKLAPVKGAQGYAVAHSSALYVVDGNGELREVLDWDTSAAVMRKDFAALLQS